MFLRSVGISLPTTQHFSKLVHVFSLKKKAIFSQNYLCLSIKLHRAFTSKLTFLRRICGEWIPAKRCAGHPVCRTRERVRKKAHPSSQTMEAGYSPKSCYVSAKLHGTCLIESIYPKNKDDKFFRDFVTPVNLHIILTFIRYQQETWMVLLVEEQSLRMCEKRYQ